MSANSYLAKRGWCILPPQGFVASELDQDGSHVEFYNPMDRQVSFSWAEIPGAPIERLTDLRFARLLDADVIDFKQLAFVLAKILPPVGAIRQANGVRLADGRQALELFIESHRWCHMILFPGPRQKVSCDPGVAESRRWLPDPLTGEPLLCGSQCLAVVTASSGVTQMWSGLGHDRYERLTFSCDAQRFERWLPVVRPQLYTFGYQQRPLYPFEEGRNYASFDDWLADRFPSLAPR